MDSRTCSNESLLPVCSLFSLAALLPIFPLYVSPTYHWMMAPFGLVSVELAFCVCVGLNLQKKPALWIKIDGKALHHQLAGLTGTGNSWDENQRWTDILPHLTQIHVIIVTLVVQIRNDSFIHSECQVGETLEQANMVRMKLFCLDTQIQPSLRSV